MKWSGLGEPNTVVGDRDSDGDAIGIRLGEEGSMIAIGIPVIKMEEIDAERLDRGQIAPANDQLASTLEAGDVLLGAP